MIRAVVHAKHVDRRLAVGPRFQQSATGPAFQAGRLLIAMTLVSILLTACAHQPPGTSYGPWQLRGTVVDIRDDHVRVRHKSGQIVDLVLDDRTAIVGKEGKAARSALTGGRRVVVNVEPLGDGRARAAQVRIFGPNS